MNGGTHVETIPKIRRCYKDTKANLDALTGLQDEDLAYGTDTSTLYRQNGAGAANWEVIATPTSAGEGHILILPFAYDSIGQGTWAFESDAANAWGVFHWVNSSTNDGDNISYKVYLATGTYTLGILCRKDGDHGIIDIDIDAGEVASFDLYNAATQRNRWVTQAAIAISTSGLKTLKVRLDGKNGASTDFIARIQAIILWRTT